MTSPPPRSDLHLFNLLLLFLLLCCPACILCVVLGEYLCLQKELEAIPMTSEERESRERRATAQHALNVAAERARELDAHEPHERMTLMADVDSDREGGITTTTIRLTPNNVFNV